MQRVRKRSQSNRPEADAARNGTIRPPIVWPPPLSYRQMRHIAAVRLPGVQYRRHVLWRYSLRWTKPARSCWELTMRWEGVSA